MNPVVRYGEALPGGALQMQSRSLREERGRLAEAARAIMNAYPSGDIPGAKLAEFDRMMAEADALKVKIDRIENLERTEHNLAQRIASGARGNGMSEGQFMHEMEERDRAFKNYMRFGLGALNAEDASIMNAAGVTTGVGGGFTVPEGFYGKFIEAQKAFGGMLDAGTTILDTTSGNPLPIPVDNDTGNVGYIVAENVQMPDAPDIAFGQVVLSAYEYSCRPLKISRQLLQDSAFNLESWIPMKLGTRVARIVNTHLTVGDGVGKPIGVLPLNASAGTPGATFGAAGATGETTSIIWDDLVNLEHALDPAYRRNKPKFMFHDQTLKMLKKIKDTQNRPLWLPGIAVGEADTILGYQYVVNQDMPVPSAGAKTILFGDFSNYFVRRVAGMSMMRLEERYADYNQVAFLVFQRWDGVLIDAGTHPVVYFQQSAT